MRFVSASSVQSATRRTQATRCTLENSSNSRLVNKQTSILFVLYFQIINRIVQVDNEPNLNCGISVEYS